MMGFGKHVWGVLVVVAVSVILGAIAWYCLSGFGGRDFEKEGTLVQMEAPADGETICPAFVTNPASIVVDGSL